MVFPHLNTVTPFEDNVTDVLAEDQVHHAIFGNLQVTTLPTAIKGSATAGSTGQTLVASGATFVSSGVVVGDVVYNATDASYAIVKTVSSETQIITTPLKGGAVNLWSNADSFSVKTCPNMLILLLTTDGANLPGIYVRNSGNTTWNAKGTSTGSNTGDQTSVLLNGPGVYVLPSITDNADGTVTMGIGEYVFALDTVGTGPNIKFTIAGALFSLTDNVTNYIYADYNSGSPIVAVTTNPVPINAINVLPIYTIFRYGTSVNILSWDTSAKSPTGKMIRRFARTRRFEAETGGLVIGEVTGRNVTVTAGTVWNGIQDQALTAYDSTNTGTDLMYLYSHVAGVYTRSVITAYNNTQYDNGTNLATLGANRYAVNWVWRSCTQNNKETFIVLGTGDYTLTQAQGSTIPAPLPAEITGLAVFVGRIIVQKSATTATQIDSSFAQNLNLTPSNDHTLLSNLIWTNSNHTGTASKIIGFNASGVATEVALSGLTFDGTTLIGSFAGINNIGYLNIPQNSQSAAYTAVLGDSGSHIYHPSADTTARTWTIPANSSVAYPIGTALTFVNDTSAGVITIAITTDTLVLAGAGTTGSRTLAANGIATAIKVTSTRWMISGTNLT